ncbi:tRNA splicing endonuclease 54 [Desmophyllum pertusum]|uniref:tRNA splicing endonuclease 54 n=1 Tax=Desmophyllum pertusum TaxID=174260 RepID=A0A9X0CH14_9CNID|nr:tRNA splicing endonuclease 54 [Desmophyllum pertusum]
MLLQATRSSFPSGGRDHWSCIMANCHVLSNKPTCQCCQMISLPDHYLVYTYFLRLGFTVLQHSSRHKGAANVKTENKNQQENEQKEKTATTAAADDDNNDNNVSEDDEDGKPIISSPVAHLWTSKDGCRPLVRPEDATSTAAVLSKLQVIKNQRMTEADCVEPSSGQQSLQVVFDVYQPGLNFKKTDPGSPDFCITVCRFCDPPPSLAVLTVLRKECFPIPLKIALVDGGSISFYSVLDVDSPTFITRG